MRSTATQIWLLAAVLTVAVAAALASPRPASAQEPALDAPPLLNRWFRAWPVGAGGAHPIAQLPDGDLVVGTETGVVRFDGRRMSALPLPGGAAPSPVKLLLVDAAGTLHAACADGTHLCVAAADAWVAATKADVPTGEGDKGREPTTICVDREGDVWIGHRNGLVSRTSGRRTTWLETATADTSTADPTVQVAADTGGRVWMARKGCLAVWSGARWEPQAALSSGQLTLAAARDGGLWIRIGGPVFRFAEGRTLVRAFKPEVPTVRAMHEDSAGRLWMATSRYGLVVWDGQRLATAMTSAPSIYSVFTDREGSLWAGTTAGLEQGGEKIVRRIEMPTVKPLRAVCTTAAGDTWFITLDGELGCQRRDTATFPSRFDGWKHGVVTAISLAPDGTLWLGTQDGGVVRMTGDPETANTENLALPPDLRGLAVRSLAATSAGLWAALGPHLLWTDGREWLRCGAAAAGDIALVVADEAGGAWAATAAGEILRAAPPAGAGIAVERITPRDLPAGEAVTAICPMADGGAWMATRHNGLWRRREGNWARVGTAEGLPSATLLALALDDGGRVWCAGGRVFFAVALEELEAVAAGTVARCHPWVTSGDNELAFFDPAVVPPDIATRAPDGRILVVLPTGVAVCEPDRLRAAAPPQVDVVEVRADGRVVAPPAGAGYAVPSQLAAPVPPDTRSVAIAVAERSLVTPTNARVQHRLAGIDDDWVDTPADRVITYERLPAGRHALALRCTTDKAEWESAAGGLLIDVEPRLHERPWFRAGVVLGAASVAAGLAFGLQAWRSSRRIARLREAAALDRERMRIARDMHDEVGTSLTQISLLTELIRRRAADETAGALDDVTSIARATVSSLDEIVWAVNPRHDTLAHVLSYVSLHASQTLGRLGIACTIDAPETLEPRPAPTDFRRAVLAIVKEAIGNVSKHSGARSATLTIRIDAGRLRITIADDGKGPAEDGAAGGGRPRPSAGLDNMRARAADLGGTCTVGPRPGGGTLVDLHVPLPAA